MAMMFQMYQQMQNQSSGSSARPPKRQLALTYNEPLALKDQPSSSTQPAQAELQAAQPQEPNLDSMKTMATPEKKEPEKLVEMPKVELPDDAEKDEEKPGKGMTALEQASLVAGRKPKKVPAGNFNKKIPAGNLKASTSSASVKKAPAGLLKTKPSKVTQGKNGWRIEEQIRESGQTDKYYISPRGVSFRLRHEAEAEGFRG